MVYKFFEKNLETLVLTKMVDDLGVSEYFGPKISYKKKRKNSRRF